MRKALRWLILPAALVLFAAACGEETPAPGGDGDGGGTIEPPVVYDTIGEGEGSLELIAWHGYTEDGTTEGYEEYDWVTPFEDKTGCQVNVTYADTSDEMVTLMRQGGGSVYDGLSASGNASNRLIAAGDVGAVDPSLFPEMANVIGPLDPDTGTNNAHYVVDGNMYGTPYMYGPNFLMYNTDVVKPAPTSWDITFEANSPYAGKITAYDDPIFIADAAMYLMTHNPDLGITDPYALNREQFDAALNLLRQQRELVGRYWHDAFVQIDDFANGEAVASSSWPFQRNVLAAEDPAFKSSTPEEGVTGWADTTMMHTDAPHPNCAYMWLEWSLNEKLQGDLAAWFGTVPAVLSACEGNELLTDEGCVTNGLGDFDQIEFWRTPQADCFDDDEATECVPYLEWVTQYVAVIGGR
jgi:putative spermidine/putrescine transport system substrate-binding protein